jgi:simple sugar transport system ATP-binding protein
MRSSGHTIVFITHKLNEVIALADVVTVLRQGRVVATLNTSEATPQRLARLMIGREVVFDRLKRTAPDGTPNLTVDQLWVHNDRGTPALRGISFVVHTGEILGVTGVSGNGQRELVEALTGLRQPPDGRIQLGNREITGASVRYLFDHMGLAHIPEDRYRMGIVPSMSVAENFALKHYRTPPMARGPWLNRRAMTTAANRAIHDHAIATPNAGVPAGHLSGGNIQKLILAREFAGRPRLVIAVHPTHGLDVGATARTHELLMQQRHQGATVLLVSEDLDEVMRLADRVLVLCDGNVTGMVQAATTTSEQLGMMMAGVSQPGVGEP